MKTCRGPRLTVFSASRIRVEPFKVYDNDDDDDDDTHGPDDRDGNDAGDCCRYRDWQDCQALISDKTRRRWALSLQLRAVRGFDLGLDPSTLFPEPHAPSQDTGANPHSGAIRPGRALATRK